MVTFSKAALDQYRERKQQQLNVFYSWCEQHNIQPLNQWMCEHGLQTQDLLVEQLIYYPNALLLAAAFGVTSEPKLTLKASACIQQYCPNKNKQDDAFAFSYIIDEITLAAMLRPHALKNQAARYLDYIAEQVALHNTRPTLAQFEQHNAMRYKHGEIRALPA